MVAHKFNSIRKIIDFKNPNNEPHTHDEKYILRAMWVMMMAEFEGAIKELVENHIIEVKKLPINNIDPCILLTHFSGKETYDDNKKFPDNPIEKLSKIHELQDKYNRDNTVNQNLIEKISYEKFTKDNKPKYKYKEVVNLFNSLGVFFNHDEHLQLSKLKSIEKTRDFIAHGNSVDITAYELRDNLIHLENIFKMLETHLD